MNKRDLAVDVAGEFSLTRTESEKIIDYILEDIANFISIDDRVFFRGFGSFTREKRKASRRRHPKTKKMINLPAYHTVKFTPSKALQEKMNPDTKRKTR